jgi:hypothetical protein
MEGQYFYRGTFFSKGRDQVTQARFQQYAVLDFGPHIEGGDIPFRLFSGIVTGMESPFPD